MDRSYGESRIKAVLQARQVVLSDGADSSMPSAMAFSREGTAVLIGDAALNAPAEEYDLLLNWKLLLGRASAVLIQQRAESEALSRILGRYSLDQIAAIYFGQIIKQVREQTSAHFSSRVSHDSRSGWFPKQEKFG
jgi:molecular chaperone DnaK (HSP70)